MSQRSDGKSGPLTSQIIDYLNLELDDQLSRNLELQFALPDSVASRIKSHIQFRFRLLETVRQRGGRMATIADLDVRDLRERLRKDDTDRGSAYGH